MRNHNASMSKGQVQPLFTWESCRKDIKHAKRRQNRLDYLRKLQIIHQHSESMRPWRSTWAGARRSDCPSLWNVLMTRARGYLWVDNFTTGEYAIFARALTWWHFNLITSKGFHWLDSCAFSSACAKLKNYSQRFVGSTVRTQPRCWVSYCTPDINFVPLVRNSCTQFVTR
jgi:hypothetical protein